MTFILDGDDGRFVGDLSDPNLDILFEDVPDCSVDIFIFTFVLDPVSLSFIL